MLVVLVIDAVVAALTGAVIVVKARTATRLEIASSMQLAGVVVADTIRLLQDAPAPVLLKSIDLHFQQIRHVRIVVVDAAGHVIEAKVDPHLQAPQSSISYETPTWFAMLASPQPEHKDYPVVVRGQKMGVVTIRSDPDDEVGEAWNYAYGLFVTLVLLNIPVLAALFFLFGRILAPLSRLGSGLQNIQNKDYEVRLPPPSLLELATITEIFNCMAESLAASQDANRGLNRQLLTAQDDERRRTALELHDEVGPCLFALEANATSITNLTRLMTDGRLQERAKDVVALVGRVQEINRRVLDRLRPMTLGQIPLSESLDRLLTTFPFAGIARKGTPIIETSIVVPHASYGRLVDLTIYRCVQEGVNNAVRHARANFVIVTLEHITGLEGTCLSLCVKDDGCGMSDLLQSGRGLAGMRERIDALGGTFGMKSSVGGTTLSIKVPIDAREVTSYDGDPLLRDADRYLAVDR